MFSYASVNFSPKFRTHATVWSIDRVSFLLYIFLDYSVIKLTCSMLSLEIEKVILITTVSLMWWMFINWWYLGDCRVVLIYKVVYCICLTGEEGWRHQSLSNLYKLRLYYMNTWWNFEAVKAVYNFRDMEVLSMLFWVGVFGLLWLKSATPATLSIR